MSNLYIPVKFYLLFTFLILGLNALAQSNAVEIAKAKNILKNANRILKKNPDKAIFPIKKAQFIFKNANLYEEQINCKLSLAEIHVRLSDYRIAYNLLTNALSMSIEHNLPLKSITALKSLGRVSAYLGEIDRAISFNKDAIELAEQKDLRNEITILKANIAYIEIYYNDKKTNENFVAIQNMYAYSSKNAEDTIMLTTALNYMGGAYFAVKKDYLTAAYYLKKSVEIADLFGDLFRESLLLNNLGEIYFKSNKIKEAEIIFERSLKIAINVNSKLLIYNCYMHLSNCAESKGDLKQALKLYKKYMDIRSEVLNEDLIRKSREYFSLYQIEHKARNNDRKKSQKIIYEKEKETKIKTTLWIFGTTLIIFLFIIILLTINRKRLRDSLEKKKTIEGQNEALLIVNKDLWDQKNYADQAKKEAEVAIKSKIDFFSIITHELRTPLNAVIGIVQLLQEDDPADHQKRSLNILKFSSDNLLNLINDVLDFNKIEAGKVELDIQPFLFSSLLFNIKNSLQFKADEKGLDLRLKIDKNLPSTLLGDKLRIGQVFYNLISNAIKFTHKGFVEIEIRYYTNNSEANLMASVKDTGIGIADEKQKDIFDFFSQADSSIGGNYGGSGLGLTISKNLIHLMGSTINLESKVNLGSKFFFSLLLPEANSPKIEFKVDEKFLPISSYKILFVEDVDFNRIIAERFFMKWNLNYDTAKTASEAIELANKKEYDLILMDLNLPDMSGFDAANQIRKIQDNSNLKIVALSAFTYEEVKERILLSKMDGFIQKPFVSDELRNSIIYWLNESKKG